MSRFTIRDVLWLTVVVALGVGWWLERRVLVARADTLATNNESLSAAVENERNRAEQAYRILTHSLDATAGTGQ